MLCSSDDFLLKIFAKIVEVIAVASNADYKVTVIFGMFLCLPQGSCVNNVELDVVSIHPEIASYKVRNFSDIFVGLEKSG